MTLEKLKQRELLEYLLEMERALMVWQADKIHYYSYSQRYNSSKVHYLVCDAVVREISRLEGRVRVLDAGCGEGLNTFLTNHLLQGDPRVQYLGFDLDWRVVRYAQRRAAFEGCLNMSFLPGNIYHLGFLKGDQFNVVICSEVLEHLTEPEKALPELYRLTKPGGLLVTSAPNAHNPLSSVLSRFSSLKTLVYRGSIEGPTPPHLHPQLYVPPDVHYQLVGERSWREQQRALVGAGFVIERMRRTALHYGADFFDRHPALFGTMLLAEALLERLPVRLGLLASRGVIFLARKTRS